MKKQFLVFILPVVFACACKTVKKTATDNGVNNAELITEETFRKPLADKELFKSTTDMVPIDTAYVSKDTLNIFTKKILGCDADNFKLIWSGNLGKAEPPQAGVKLFQLVDGACRERHKFHLVFNLLPLKLKNDTSAVKITLIKVGGWSKTCSYTHN